MRRRDEVNPYHGLSLVGMVNACHSVLRDVNRAGPRTRDERADLAERVHFLLIAVIQIIDPQHYMQDSPENLLRLDPQKSVFDYFLRWHARQLERAQSAVRLRTASRAADWVLGDVAHPWLHPQQGAFAVRPNYMASNSEDGLQAVLKSLDELYRTLPRS
jgi:hypothetical protein